MGKLYVFSVQYTWNESNINHAIPCNSWVWGVQPHHQVCPPRYPMCAIVNCWILKPKAMGNGHQSSIHRDLSWFIHLQGTQILWDILGWHPHHPSHGASKNPRNSYSGWWFGTFFIFHNIWENPFHWLIFYRGVETTNQYSIPISAMTPTFIRHETASTLWLLTIAMEATSQPRPILLTDLWWFTVFQKLWVSMANCYITRG